ncbi:MAG: hypothetical protein JO100_06050 [Pseudonocardia sp.]|nr:hypothetical protein [Pseudonocardia sp.]
MSTPRPPTKQIDDGVRDNKQDIRQFLSFTPVGRRATIYEDVTVDTQTSPLRHQVRGFPTTFEDGRTSWQTTSTRLRHEDWYQFRDPAGMWERTYYQIGSRYERSIEDGLNVARRDGHLARLDKGWIEFLRGHFQQLAYAEHGMWLLLAVAARDGLSDTITHCICFEAAMKQRQAQAVVLYAMDLEPVHGEFPIETAKQSFLDDRAWQPLRRTLEELTTVTDWGERVVAVNLCLEPLVGVLLRRELYLRGCAVAGDTVLPTLLNAAQLEYQYSQDWTEAMIRMVLSSPSHGAGNARVLGDWLTRWLPKAREAAEALRLVFAAAPAGVDFAAAVAATEADLSASFTALDLTRAGVPV